MVKRIEWVDVIKGVLILTVILGHAIQETLKVRGVCFEENIFRNIIYSFHMPAFMAMSGYMMYRPNKEVVQLYKRFKQLIIPFIIWSIPLFFVTQNVENIWEYVLYPNKGYWFLWALFFIIILYYIIEWICNKITIKQELLVSAISILLVGIQMILLNPKLFGYEYIAYYFLFFMLGYYMRKYNDLLPQKKWFVVVSFVLWAFMACYWTPNGLPFFLEGISFIPSKVLQLGYRMLTPVIFIFWMYSFVPKLKNRNSWLWTQLIEIGQISLGLYLSHMVVKKIFAELLLDYFPRLPICINILIEFVFLTFISIVCVKLIKKNRILSKWLLGIQQKS